MAKRPRWLKPDAVYCETQRTVDRQFLFKPDPTVRNIIGACAGRAQKKYPVILYWIEFNINHKHTGKASISDSKEHLQNLVKFDQLFNSLVAREVNRHLDREGPLFSTRNRSDEAVDDTSLEQQLLYAVTNPVKDGLVDRIAHWKGFSSYEQLATGRVETFTYLDRTAWHRAGGEGSGKSRAAFTKTVTVEFSPIPSWEHLPDHKRQAQFRRLVRKEEQSCRAEREKEGRKEMGSEKLAKIDPRDRPKTKKPRTRQPLCHASSVEAADEYKESWRSFLDLFLYASGMWLEGARDVEFPPGSFRPPLIQLC